MSHLTTPFGQDWLLVVALGVLMQATVVAAVALAISRWLCRGPVARHAVLCGALALILATPGVALLVPSRWSVWSYLAPMASNELPTKSAPLTNNAWPSTDSKREQTHPSEAAVLHSLAGAALHDADEVSGGGPTALSPVRELATAHRVSLASPVFRNVGGLLRPVAYLGLAMWSIVAAWLLIRIAASWWKLCGVLRRAAPFERAEAQEAICDACRSLGQPRDGKATGARLHGRRLAIRLVVSDEAPGPLAAGIWRPAIVLPRQLVDAVSPRELREIVVHEAAHVHRRDQAVLLLQHIAAAAFWIHPLVWRLNNRLAQAREEVCDNFVLASAAASEYSRTLLRLAELLQSGDAWSAAPGLFTSGWSLERRVAGILDERRERSIRLTRRGRCFAAAAMLLCSLMSATAGAALAAEGEPPVAEKRAADESLAAAAEAEAAPASDEIGRKEEESDELQGDGFIERLEQLSFQSAQTRAAIRTAHLKYWIFLRASDFKPGLSPAQMTGLMAAHDLVNKPESLGDVADAIMATPINGPAKWGELELHAVSDSERGTRLRETRHWPDGDPDIHVVAPDVSLHWSARNAQMDIVRPEEDFLAIGRVDDFLRGLPLQSPFSRELRQSLRGAKAEAIFFEGRPALKVRIDAAASVREIILDEATGFLQSDDSWRGNRFESRRWLGWREWHGGIKFPAVVVDLKYTDSQLTFAKFLVVRDARFNIPLADTLFKLGAPAGSVIVRRGDGGDAWPARRINRDVFDVTSVEEVSNAVKPYRVEFTPAELDAFVELRQMYALADDDVVKRVAPPFPLSRKYLSRLLHPSTAERPRTDTYYFLVWEGDRLDSDYQLGGLAPTVASLIEQIVKHPLIDCDIPQSVLEQKAPGDFVYRPESSQEERIAAVSEILSQELGRSVRLAFADAERQVYVARGELKLNEAKVKRRDGRPQIMMNGGEHDGNFGEVIGFGALDRLLRGLSDYIDTKIIDETTPSTMDLAWSRRWYDLKTTPAAKRFQVEPEKVLELITEQTGIEFVEQRQTVRVLRLEER